MEWERGLTLVESKGDVNAVGEIAESGDGFTDLSKLGGIGRVDAEHGDGIGARIYRQ